MKEAKVVAIVMNPETPPRLVELAGSVDKFSEGDEIFTAESNDPSWLGFYDWLRTREDKIVGLRIELDDGSMDIRMFQTLRGVVVGSDRATVQIFFSDMRGFDEDKSGDADFGGNRIYRGSRGSVALTVYAP